MPSQHAEIQARHPNIQWSDAEDYAKWLAYNIKASGFIADVMLVVARGGLSVAGLLYKHLDVPAIEVVRCTSYNGEENTGELKMSNVDQGKLQRLNFEGAKILIVDDIYDTGATMAFLKHMLPQADVRAACLINKMHKGHLSIGCDFYGAWMPPVWTTFPWESQEG